MIALIDPIYFILFKAAVIEKKNINIAVWLLCEELPKDVF